ncbi:hypothetical protein SAMN05443575_2411 [Jatrophihabitans endophyticus]|uniref:Uncharacterized protein n=1 Tax=Jatrophihabitans endophyticus TaxID=1206085 RepID=A0A1M5LCA8_9ACTN|nr:DUF6716 putative glycosyltransferase [Jatrophihabitans endophyticus]SHG62648.1 hypothetical protein SAMN05443575_2411 [Jatrophihabitans endophyticus]
MTASPPTTTDDGTETPPWRVEVVADSDSRWKWGATVAARLVADRPAQLHATLLLGRSVPNDQQLADIGITPASLRRASIAETVARLADSDAEVVVLACIGGCVQSLLHALGRAWRDRPTRPVVVTGYVGLVYEKIIDGLVNRAGADLVLANCDADAARFADVFADLGADPKSVVATALPFLGGAPYDAAQARQRHPFTLTFVTQPGVPQQEAERRHVLEQAAAYGRRHPDHAVVVKLRARVGDRTTHVEPFHFEALLPPEELPPNLTFAYGAMDAVLDRTDLCVTVSSTAAIEAMHRGIPTALLTDYGIRESLGNQLFVGSGAMTSWPSLLRGELPVTRPEWAAAHGVVVGPDSYTAAADRLGELVAKRAELPPLRPWLDEERAGAYLPGLLARYGIDRTGAVLAPSDAIGTRPSFARRAARVAARRAYRYGVRVVEPRVKRIAQL